MKTKAMLTTAYVVIAVFVLLLVVNSVFVNLKLLELNRRLTDVVNYAELLDADKQELKSKLTVYSAKISNLEGQTFEIKENVKKIEADKKQSEQESCTDKVYPYIAWYDMLAKKYGVDYNYVFDISQIVIKYCKKYKISSNHIMALIGVESEFRPNAVSFKGKDFGSGLCQVSKIVRQEYNWKSGTKIPAKHEDLFNEEKNIEIACWYYARLHTHYGVKNSIGSLMSAYNRGYQGGYATGYVRKINANLSMMK